MNKIKIGVFAAGLASGILPLAGACAAPSTYAVTVTNNQGSTFSDCFTFKGAYLFVAGLSTKALITTAAPTTPKYYYTATATLPLVQDFGATIAFSGFKTGNSTTGSLSAIGATSDRFSFTVSGTAVPSCTADARVNANYWKPAAH